MDWKAFIYFFLLYEFIQESDCSLNFLSSTFYANGIDNGLVVNNTFGPSDNVSCLVYADEASEDSIGLYSILHTTTEMLFTTHFTSAGYYDIYMACFGSEDFSNKSENIYLGSSVTGLEVINASWLKPTYLTKPLTEDVTIEVFFKTGTNVNLTVILMNTSDVPSIMTDVVNGSYNQFSFSKTLFEGSYMRIIKVETINPLGVGEWFHVIIVQEAVNVSAFNIIPYPETTSDTIYVMTNLSFDITPVVSSGEMLSFTATINDEFNVIDVISCCQYTDLTTCDISYTLSTTGIYYIDAHVANQVSSQEKMIEVNSMHEVNGFLATVSTNLALNNVQIEFRLIILQTAKYPMGIVKCETFYGDGNTETLIFNISETLPDGTVNLNHLYVAGWYTASINCSNQLPFTISPNIITGEIFTFDLIVENRVENNIQLVQNSPNASHHPFSRPIAIDIRLTDPQNNLPLENITCTFAHGDAYAEVPGSISDTSYISYNLDIGKSGLGDGDFLLTVNCSNRLQHQLLTQTFSVYYDCWKRSFFDTIYKDPANAQTAQTNVAKIVLATLATTGFCSLPHASIWTVHGLTGVKQGSVTHYKSEYLKLQKTFPADTIEEGDYKIEFTVNVTINGTSLSVSDSFYLNYTLPNLLPAIYMDNSENFMRRISTRNRTHIVLNTENTIDPADGLGSVAALHLNKTMTCATSSSWDDDAILSFMAEESAIGSVDSCDHLMLADGDNFLVAVDDITEGQWYMFTLTVTRSHRTATVLQAILPANKFIPDVSFQNIANGFPTSSNFYKLTMADLQLNVISNLDNGNQVTHILHDWRMELYDNNSLNYVKVMGVISTGIGFKVHREMFQSWNGLKYRLSCTVSIAGSENVTLYRLFIMNQAPYNGNCSLNVGAMPAIPGRTEVCFYCNDWKDEAGNFFRDPLTDLGGMLAYFPVQIFLTADGKVDKGILEYSHIALTNVNRCFKLVRPSNRDVNQTRIEVRVQDELLTPYSTVTFGDIEIENTLIIENADDVYELYTDVYLKDLDDALEINHLQEVIQLVTLIAADINIDVPEDPPGITVFGLAPEVGNMGDILANGTAVSFGDVLKDLIPREPDPLLQAIQETNFKIIQALQTTISRQSSNLTLPQILQIAQWVLSITSNKERNFNKTSLSLLENMTGAVFMVINNEEGDSTIADEIRQVCMQICSSLAGLIVPDTLKYLETDVSLADQRKRNENAGMFASQEYKQFKETHAKMSENERDYYIARALLKLKVEVDDIQDLAKSHAQAVKEFQTALVRNVKVSYGAETVFGDNTSVAMMTTDSPEFLANRIVSTSTTTLSFEQVNVKGKAPIAIGVFESSQMMNIDKDGKAAKITSTQKRLVIQSDGEIPKKILYKHKIPEVKSEIVTPFINEEDASKFDYRIVLLDRPDDDLYIGIQPTSETVDGYMVYIFYTDDENKHVSKIQYAAKAESRYPEYIARFPPNVRGSQTGVWQIGIETIFSAQSTRSRRAAPPVLIPESMLQLIAGTSAQSDPPSVNDTGPEYPPYKLMTATMGCQTWDDDAEIWRSDECKGDWIPETSELRCQCESKHEMTFANSFYVPPNTIDFNTVFLKFSPLNQAAVMATLGLVFISYIFVVIWARRQDKKDLLKWGVTPLCDNFSIDNYFYIIKVYTGLRPGSGTRSRISMVIAGETLDTGIRELADGVRHEITTGSVMTFLMATPQYLGDLEYMRIWHDNSGGGEHASWYLSKLELYDLQLDETFTFLVEQWLTVEDGVLECVVPVCKNENLNVFKNRIVNNMKDNIAESHMWLSIAYRPSSSNFTRVQRASCALVFIMLSMISNAIFFKGSNEENYETPAEFQVGPFRFSLQQIYISFISALIVTPATLLLIYLFKMSKVKSKKIDKVLYKPEQTCCCIPVIHNWLEREQERSMELEKQLILKGYPELTGFTLPENCIILAWFIVVVATFLPAFFIMLYSMEWGKQTSEEWVTTFLLSIFESVVCLDPAKVFFMAIMFAMIFRTISTPTVAFSRHAVIKTYSPEMRGRSNGIRLPAPPLDKKTLKKARTERQRERKMKGAFVQIVLCILLIWILLSISFSSRDERSYDMNQRVVDTFLEPFDTPAFSSIKTTNDFFDWLNKTFIEKAFPETEIDGSNTQLPLTYRAFIAGGGLFRVGPPRLRQLRTTEDECPNPYFETEACFKKYKTMQEDSEPYCIGWKNGPCDPTEKLNYFSSDAWKFTSALDIWGVPIAGYYTTYGGGGYIAKLSVNRQLSYFIIDELYENSWVDRQTRAVVIEFTLYCSNANLFVYSMFMVEFLETGGAFTFYTIIPLRVYHHLGSLGLYTLVCELFFLFYLFTETVLIILKIVKDKIEFFKNNWNMFDLVFVILGYISIAMYITQHVLVDQSLQIFLSDKREFVNFYHIAIWNQVLVLMIGVLVFMAIIRMIEVLGYNKRVGVIVRVFSKAAGDLFWFGIFFLFFFTVYATSGYLLFGWKLKSYMNIFKAMETLFISMLGKSRFSEIENTDPILSKVYFMAFIFLVVYMILTMFLGILSKAIDDAASETKKYKDDEMVDYIIAKLQGLLRNNNNKNSVRPSQVHKKSVKYVDRLKQIVDEDPRDVLLEIREAITNTLTADPKGFTTPDCGKKSKFRMK